jgi:DNA-binding transcriptional regulator YiaG
MDQALRFKAMYSRLGFSVVDVARFLQVTPRTVHAWISGRVRIPFAAYKRVGRDSCKKPQKQA